MRFLKFERAKDGGHAYICPEHVVMVCVVNGVTTIRTTAGGDNASVGVREAVFSVIERIEEAKKSTQNAD